MMEYFYFYSLVDPALPLRVVMLLIMELIQEDMVHLDGTQITQTMMELVVVGDVNLKVTGKYETEPL